jgi:DNA-3-methyladenine glycosylase II
LSLSQLYQRGGHGRLARGCRSPQNGAVTFPHPPPAARAALALLCAHDQDLQRIEAAAGPLPWRTRAPGYPGLLQAIVAQQISNQAASAIWRRLAAVPGALTPAGLPGVADEALRAAGLSRPKVAHARALAAAFTDGILSEPALAEMDDEAAVAAIAAVRGMGRWSAEIYLLFALGRQDVFPAGDLALAAAAAHLKGLPARPSPAALHALADAWRPHRGLAARLLWHHWRHVTGRAALDDLVVHQPAGAAT